MHPFLWVEIMQEPLNPLTPVYLKPKIKLSGQLQNRRAGQARTLPVLQPQPAAELEHEPRCSVTLAGHPAIFFSGCLIYGAPIVNRLKMPNESNLPPRALHIHNKSYRLLGHQNFLSWQHIPVTPAIFFMTAYSHHLVLIPFFIKWRSTGSDRLNGQSKRAITAHAFGDNKKIINISSLPYQSQWCLLRHLMHWL